MQKLNFCNVKICLYFPVNFKLSKDRFPVYVYRAEHIKQEKEGIYG